MAAVDLDLRMLLFTESLCSSPLKPHIALLHREYASGTTGHLGVSWELNEAHLFFSLSYPLPLSQPLSPNTNNPYISHLAWQQNRYCMLGNSGSEGIAFCKVCLTWPELQSLHVRKVMPFNLPLWQYSYLLPGGGFHLSGVMRYPSKLMASSQISLLYRDGVCEKSAALLMSSFHLTFLPPVVLDAFIFGTYATSSQNGSHAEMGGHAGGRTVVTPMWGEHLNDCLFAVLLWRIDSELKMMAWHNHLPSRVFNLNPLMDSGFLSSLFVYLHSDIENA